MPSGASPVAGHAVDLDEMPVGVAQEELHAAVGQAVGLAAVGRALERAERLGAPAGLAEVVHGDREVVQRRDGGVALEEVQLAVAEAQPGGREADVRHRQPLAAEQLLVEARRALEVARRERDVVEADTHAARSYQIAARLGEQRRRARRRAPRRAPGRARAWGRCAAARLPRATDG